MYAGRKRRKPVQKGVKPTPAEGAKSNPSKRHRDRLNSELDRLASLLPFPEDVISSLDKLSILRLSVSYLRTKSFFSVVLKNQLTSGGTKSNDHHDSKTAAASEERIPEGELLLQALNGFVLVVTGEGTIFYCSHTIQDYLGFHQTDVMHQSVFDLIHNEDQQEFRRNLHWALNPPASVGPPTDPTAGQLPSDWFSHHSSNGESASSCLLSYNPDQLPPENSSFLERSFVCRFRCLLDNSSGFLALNIQGQLKFLHGQSRQQGDSEVDAPLQLALFAIATPLQPPAILEIRTRNMIFRTKHKLDFTPMACDAKGKIVLGYTEAELRVRGSGYQFIHAADMLYCAENHVRMIKTGESGLTVFRLLTKDNRWKWVQANARLVYKNGKPDYIIATQRPLVDEEGGEHLRKRSMHLPFTFATGEALLYQTGYPLHGFPDSSQAKAKGSKSKKSKLDKSSSDDLDPKSLLGALMSQDESVYVCQPDSEPKMSFHSSLFTEQHAEGGGFSGLLGSDSWHIISNREMSRCSSKMSSYDPLLATLDSLSLDGDDTCSNSELFSALENLGLNAEDLELLLLDERMIQVDMDPNHIPSLSDLLTNNEILSYIHDSLESKGGQPGDGLELLTHLPAQSATQQPQSCLASAVAPPSSEQTIIQPSQQMQQHISAGELVKHPPGTEGTNVPPGIPNSHWVFTSAWTPNHTHHHPQTLVQASQSSSEHKPLHSSLESSQWQLQAHPQASIQSSLLPAFQSQLGPTTNGGPFIPNGHTTTPPHVELSDDDGLIPHAGGTVPNGVCHQQSSLTSTQSYQPQGHHKHLPLQLQQLMQQAPGQSSALELEQFLGLSKPQPGEPLVEAYGSFHAATQESPHSKLENGRLLSATNAAYIRTCLMPSGNGVAAGDIPVSCPDGHPALQDSQRSGFFL
ncbi:aryl hydrocarbon receptor-like [Aulostomus maculatus]